MSSLIELMHTVFYDRAHDIPQYNISIDITLLYVLKYNNFYCSLQILNDQSVGKKLILFAKNLVASQEGIEEDIEIPEKENQYQRVQSFAILAQKEKLHFSVCKFTKAKLSGWSTFAGNDAEKLHLQTKVCFFHFKIVNSLLRGCFDVPGSLYQLALDLRTKTSTNTRFNSKF